MKTSFRQTKNIEIIEASPFELVLRVQCQAGYQCGFVRMWPGVFDASGLDVVMDEFPSGKSVLTQGWDLRPFDEKCMAVPTFTAYLNGRDVGDVWFDVPNYLDHRRGVLDTEFGFYAGETGKVELRLVIIPADRPRFRWDMIECLDIAPDDRKPARLSPRNGLRRDQPWLFLAGRSVAKIRADFVKRKEFQSSLAYLEEVVRDYDGTPPENRDLTKKPNQKKKSPPAYHPLDQVTAGAALATGSKVWQELARATLRRLCLMPTWCRDNHPARLMSGDNDMVIGHPLLALSMLYHYLRDDLTRHEYALALAKAQEYGRKLYDFSVLQKRYATGMGHILSHESCPLLGLGVCAMVFWDEIPEAPRWLAWTHGRMLTGAKDGARDGRNPWTTYGPNFLTFYACAVKDFSGESMFHIPFFRNLCKALLRSEPAESRESQYNLRWIMAGLATYVHVPEAAWEWRDLWQLQSRLRGAEHFLGWQDMFWHARQPGRAPDARYRRSFLFKDTGLAMLRTDDEPAALCCFYQSGLAVGRAGFKHRKRYSMEHHDAHADGGLSVFVKGRAVTVPAPSQYLRGFALQSVVTVNGSGHYLDGRVLGNRLQEQWLSRMLTFRDTQQQTVAVGENTGAYRAELGVLRSQRRVTLDKRRLELVIEDSIRLRKPQQVAARFQCTGNIEKRGEGCYRFSATSGEALDVFIATPGRYRMRVGETQIVLGYGYGFNVKKGQRTQPVTAKAPPRPKFLEIAVPGRTKRAAFRVRFRVKTRTV